MPRVGATRQGVHEPSSMVGPSAPSIAHTAERGSQRTGGRRGRRCEWANQGGTVRGWTDDRAAPRGAPTGGQGGGASKRACSGGELVKGSPPCARAAATLSTRATQRRIDGGHGRIFCQDCHSLSGPSSRADAALGADSGGGEKGDPLVMTMAVWVRISISGGGASGPSTAASARRPRGATKAVRGRLGQWHRLTGCPRLTGTPPAQPPLLRAGVSASPSPLPNLPCPPSSSRRTIWPNERLGGTRANGGGGCHWKARAHTLSSPSGGGPPSCAVGGAQSDTSRGRIFRATASLRNPARRAASPLVRDTGICE